MTTDPGYSIHADVFTSDEMSAVVERLASAQIARSKAGARHVLGVPAVRDIVNDSRLLALAASVVGSNPVPFRATLFDKSLDANWLVVWHQDTALPLQRRNDSRDWGPWSTKEGVLYAHAPAWALEQVIALRVSLDDSTASNGPLRVMPGTHLRGVLEEQQIEQLASEVPSVDCVAPAGSVVAMRPLIVHASSKATDGRSRRVLHIEYATTMTLGGGVELAVA